MRLIDNIKENIKIRKRLKLQGKTNFFDSMNHAIDGINYTIERERNFKIEMIVAILVIVAGFFFEVSKTEWLILLITTASVLALELINTSIERCVDLVTKDYQELAKNAKDASAGAVLIMSFFSACVGIIIFLPKFLEMIGVN